MSFKELKNRKNGFTLIELMVVIVIIGILVSIALPNFVAAIDRAKQASVKSNMRVIQSIAETYAVDWGGVYPGTIAELKTQAVARNYWKVFKNPFTSSVDDGSDVDGTTVTTSTLPNVSGGGVGWDSPTLTQYTIYGAEKTNGKPILDRGAVFFLTNN